MSVLLVDLATVGSASLTAARAAAEWTRATGAGADHITLSDGSAGFVAALATGLVTERSAVVGADAAGTTYAAARDLGDVAALAAFVAGGAPRAVLATATGDTGTPDGGAGLLVELAVRGGLERSRAAGAVAGEFGIDGAVELLRAARGSIAGTTLVGAIDGDMPLLGLNGAAATGRWTVDAAQRQAVEGRLGAFADLVHRAAQRLGPTRLVALPRVATVAGAGSGGGLGHGILALGGTLAPALVILSAATSLAERVAAADVVVVVLPELDAQAMSEGIVPLVGPLAADAVAPLVVVTGRSLAARREWSAMGVSAVYELTRTSVARVARTWSPGAGGGSAATSQS